MRRFLSFLFKLSGWKVEGAFPENVKKYIIIVAPHTSNWDFPLGLLVRAHLKMKNARFLGKESLFRPPYGWIFSGLGGYPVDRSKNTNMVDNVAAIFAKEDHFILALAPEGTRKKVNSLKTGFWYISQKADVPIVLVGFDYPSKTVNILPPFKTTTLEQDMDMIMTFYRGMKGKRPELGLG